MTVGRAAAFIDFIERVASTAILAGYGAYVVLPHADTRADLRVAGAAAAGSAAKFIVKAIATWQAAHVGPTVPPPPPG